MSTLNLVSQRYAQELIRCNLSNWSTNCFNFDRMFDKLYSFGCVGVNDKERLAAIAVTSTRFSELFILLRNKSNALRDLLLASIWSDNFHVVATLTNKTLDDLHNNYGITKVTKKEDVFVEVVKISDNNFNVTVLKRINPSQDVPNDFPIQDYQINTICHVLKSKESKTLKDGILTLDERKLGHRIDKIRRYEEFEIVVHKFLVRWIRENRENSTFNTFIDALNSLGLTAESNELLNRKSEIFIPDFKPIIDK